MKFLQKRGHHEASVELTPLIDVVFLLLIFFMVTAAFSLQRSLQVPTPQPEGFHG